MQRVAVAALGRAACLTARRAGSAAARGRSLQLHNSWQQAPAAAVRNFHSSRPVAGAAGETFLDKGDATARIIAVVKAFEKVDPTKVSENALFKDDLALDSLDAVEVVMAIEDEFTIEIPDSEADKIAGIADAVAYIISHPAAK
ncbi:unnamed protein product [Ectocarpus sp. CCAP 1310/34]|nr:unnamed protein product [Ectocarpus sp. CCAP 1310/34]